MPFVSDKMVEAVSAKLLRNELVGGQLYAFDAAIADYMESTNKIDLCSSSSSMNFIPAGVM